MGRIYAIVFLVFQFGLLSLRASSEVVREDCCFITIDKTDVYFYKIPEKEKLVHQMVKDMPELKLMIGPSHADRESQELLIQALNFPKKDPLGAYILQNYHERTLDIIEKFFSANIANPTFDLRINFNWEPSQYERNCVACQNRFLYSLVPPIEPLVLVKDLMFADWQMPVGVFSGVIFQDGEKGDRIIFPLHPKQTIGALLVEPIESTSHWKTPGCTRAFPLHTYIAPSDFVGPKSPGVSKGKSIYSSMIGIALKKDFDSTRGKVRQAFFNRRIDKESDDSQWEYPNGLLGKRLLTQELPSILQGFSLQVTKGNIGIENVSSSSNSTLIKILADLFEIKGIYPNDVMIKKLTKKDSGFSQIADLELEVPPNCDIILVNRSKLPKGYRYFQLAQDWSKKGTPLIQLYRFEPSTILKVPSEVFQELLLTPLIDVFYRDGSKANSEKQVAIMEKLTTCIDVFIFPKKA